MEPIEPKRGKTPSKKVLYSIAAKYAHEAIEVLVKEMRSGDNSNARTGAAKTLLSKCIPDLKAVEVTGDETKPVIFKIGDDRYKLSRQAVKSVETPVEG